MIMAVLTITSQSCYCFGELFTYKKTDKMKIEGYSLRKPYKWAIVEKK
ncbi:hypothetical protein [Candidatus Merdisoma sp. JLR.KK006]